MKKIKCKCGWEGSKYRLVISIDGNHCPDCNDIIYLMQMTEKQLYKIVSGFTKGLLSGKKSEGMCFAVCQPLQAYLSLCGVDTKLQSGEFELGEYLHGHWWLQLPTGNIIDPTANQFNQYGKDMPVIFIGEKPEWYGNAKIVNL